MSARQNASKRNWIPWIIVGGLGSLAICLCLVLVSMGAYLSFGKTQQSAAALPSIALSTLPLPPTLAPAVTALPTLRSITHGHCSADTLTITHGRGAAFSLFQCAGRTVLLLYAGSLAPGANASPGIESDDPDSCSYSYIPCGPAG